MSENIKPSEVSEVLLQQLKGIDTHLQFDEVGNVLQVSDGVARIYGLRNAEANELLEFENGIMAIVMNLEEDNVGAVLLGPTDQIKEGMVVKRTKRIASINVGEGMLGRVPDNQLTLSTPDRNHGIHRLQPCLQRLVHRLTEDHSGSFTLQRHFAQFPANLSAAIQWYA